MSAEEVKQAGSLSQEAKHNLFCFFELLIEIDQEQQIIKKGVDNGKTIDMRRVSGRVQKDLPVALSDNAIRCNKARKNKSKGRKG